ncbi:transcription factor MYBS1-like isoform X2 [Zingiber officinale]|uniref:Transcription factor MYBS1 n=1 Tax=Zingiber officinale TaxID=94328 RepID=A0A8J5C6E1_ZINOF|nr:transcription factor MYBS1-like isoform X2 [Zingiber officinale]KAG6469057.1 hypothetical protein ZIOFF_073755 [Zingiber officinale]WLQ69636.1 MYB protein [Zingiber officinale]
MPSLCSDGKWRIGRHVSPSPSIYSALATSTSASLPVAGGDWNRGSCHRARINPPSTKPPSLQPDGMQSTMAAAVENWTRGDDKAFENALATAASPPEELGDGASLWETIATRLPGKTAAEVRRHYDLLLEDVKAIEAGRVPIPRYACEEATHNSSKEKHHRDGNGSRRRRRRHGCSKAEQERRKGIPWTEEEHSLFLLGLEKFGKGDWRSISRNFVSSRTPTQVASHAQKHFIRLNSLNNRDRRRSSIHDITSANGAVDDAPSSPQGAAASPMKHRHSLANVPGMAVYGPPVGHPISGHMVTAVGTPVMLPPPGHAPPYVVPVAYPVPPPPMHQSLF